jgi:hypothetical protein
MTDAMSSGARTILGRYAPEDAGEHIEVGLQNFPLQIFAEAREHHEELLREFALLALSPPVDRPGHRVPEKFLDLVTALGVKYGGVDATTDALRDDALARGELAIDLTYDVPRSVGPAMREARTLLGQADAFCRDGQMLTTEFSPVERKFLWWFFEEFESQARDLPATPWAGPMRQEF